MRCNFCFMFNKGCQIFGDEIPDFIKTIDGCDLKFNQVKKLNKIKRNEEEFEEYLREIKFMKDIYKRG